MPSTGARNSTLLNTQREDRGDAVYNGRPIQLTAPPISIYHPVFAAFKQQIAEPIDRATFTSTELRNAHQLIVDSVAFYPDEKSRTVKIQESLNVLVSPELFWNSEIPYGQRTFKPDGVMRCTCEEFPGRDTGAYEFTELKNAIGEAHSDPIHQAQCDYVLSSALFHLDFTRRRAVSSPTSISYAPPTPTLTSYSSPRGCRSPSHCRPSPFHLINPSH